MCKPISGIILKDKILFSETQHSHTEILKEHQIEDTQENAENLFVRAELYPNDGNMFSDIENWKFNVDQDILPEWFVKEYDEKRMREAVEKYAEKHIHICKSDFELNSGLHWVKDCKNFVLSGSAAISELKNSQVNEMCGNSKIYNMWGNSKINGMWGNSQVNAMWGNSQINLMWENSQINIIQNNSQVNEMRDNSQINIMQENSKVNKMWNNSQVNEMRGNSKVNEMRDDSQITIPDDFNSKNVKCENILLYEKSIIKDFRTKTIYQSGNWKLVLKKD